MKFYVRQHASIIAITAAAAAMSAPATAQEVKLSDSDQALLHGAFGPPLPVTMTVAATVDADEDGTEATSGDAAAADKNERPITPMGGNISPFTGNIDPFGATIDPFGGTIDPFGGTIDPFSGNINPFYGDIGALWGTIDPFGGTIDPFGGTIDPFGGTIDPFGGNISPFYGQIDPFKGNIDPFTGIELPSYIEFNAFWNSFGKTWKNANHALNFIHNRGDSALRSLKAETLINELIDSSAAVWGEAVEARTGQSFEDGFINPLFAKFGITGDRKTGFVALTKAQRAQLVTEWFDGLMDYTGHDHVDHWMGAVNWTPELTRIQGSGADSVIGILDASVVNDPDLQGKVFSTGGYSAAVGGHGTGVASLLVAAHDGRGVFGIAPHASVATYNPFDETGTASWDDIHAGIISLKKAGASVINMSLGIKGWTLHSEWNNVFTDSVVKEAAKDTVFVLAAGNDGLAQADDIIWKLNNEFSVLVVGSIDPLGNISSFSNRPGDACLVEKVGACKSDGSGYLRNRFLVAPGEFILVSDGSGGLTRRSGTSFAAPLVSGAITLLHDRWPWLAQHPQESADIILQSATDLGEAGVDDVYGYGLLNIEASQSPLNFNNLKFIQESYNGTGATATLSADNVLRAGFGVSWETEEAYMVVFETIGATQRDFTIPLSSRLFGQSTNTSGSEEYFQSYIQSRFLRWLESKGGNSNGSGFTDVASIQSPNVAGWSFGFASTGPATAQYGEGNNFVARMPAHTAMRMTSENGRFSLNAGFGSGAMALVGNQGFGLTTDYRSANGGVNPVLGLASGGTFIDAEFAVARNTKIAIGVTERQLDHEDNTDLTFEERSALRGERDYAASAINVRVTHTPHPSINLSLSLASVNERDALLGVQSVLDSDMAQGSNSRTVTFGGSVSLPYGFDIAGSATGGMTRSNAGERQNIRTSGGVVSSAFALSVGKQGLVGKSDNLRLSFTQPMHIENGTLEYSSVEVVDRSTGEIGTVERTFEIGGAGRRYMAEFVYAAPIGDSGEFSLFGRADMRAGSSGNSQTGSVNEMIAGGMVSLSF